MDLLEPWRNAPPARYTLESDSEDEQDPEDIYRRDASSPSFPYRPESKVELRPMGSTTPTSGKHVILAVAAAGRAWAEGLQVEGLQESSELLVNGEKVASLSEVQDTVLIFFAGHLGYEEQHKVADLVFSQLDPSEVTIIDSYSVKSYLSATEISPNIRYLATDSFPSASALALDVYEPPNLIAGLAAAVSSNAAERDLPCLLLLLPTQHGDPSGHASLQHANSYRPSAPESIYDYGGPSPYSSSLLASPQNLTSLHKLGEILLWSKNLGWKVPSKEQLDTLNSRPNTSHRQSATTNPKQAGFGWVREERRLGEREIGEGGMYL